MKRGRLGCRAGFCAGLHPMRGASVRVIGRRTGNICQGFVKNSDDFTQGVESGRKYVAATAIDIGKMTVGVNWRASYSDCIWQ